MIKVLVADSHYLIRKGIGCIVGETEDICVVGEVESIDTLAESMDAFSPDLLIIDYNDPSFPFEKLKNILPFGKGMEILAISPFQSKTNLLRGLDLGVQSFLLKSCDKKEIIDAVYATKKRENFFCGQILDQVLEKEKDAQELCLLDQLYQSCEPVKVTDREAEIIQLIARGLTNKDIADKLFLSNHTVISHRKNIMKKLSINNTAGLVVYAVKENIIDPH